MSGKLIVIEGLDGSGKSTQYALLCERLKALGVDFRSVSFPRYDKQSSVMVRQYLGGVFGDKPQDVNPYAASTFYAVDRFASYAEDWKEYYQAGGLMLLARYTTSNAAHQGSKVPPNERERFFKWLYEFEFEYLQLPAPDMVLYLDISVDGAFRRMNKRQLDTNTKGDIHETDLLYLTSSLLTGEAAADYYGWIKVACEDETGAFRSIEDINDELYRYVSEFLKERS